MKVTLKKIGPIPRTASQASVAVSAKQQAAPKYTRLTGPTHNQEAEMAVLGSCMIELVAFRVAKNILKPEMFYGEGNRIIFKSICEVVDAHNTIDIVVVGERLRALGKLLECGGMDYLIDCTNKVAYAGNVGAYSKVVAVLHYNREIIKVCKNMETSQDGHLVEKIRELVLLRENCTSPFMLKYDDGGLDDFIKILLEQKESSVLNTGIKEIDFHWNGQKPGEVNVWGAATNEGKSIMLLTLLNLAARSGQRCLFFGTEMTASETVQRHLSMVSGLEAWKIRKPKLNEREVVQLQQVIKDELAKMSVSLVDDPEPGLERIEAAIHASSAQVVFLDYLERFDMPKNDQLRLQIKDFMRKLKTMARRNNVIIHLAAQLSRATYGDVEKPPNMSDLSESSAIEKEADRVMLFWSPKKKQLQDQQGQRVIECIQMKNRQGPRGAIYDFVLNESNLQLFTRQQAENPWDKKVEAKSSGIKTTRIS